MTSEQRERQSAISKTLSDAMAARSDCDWTKESKRIASAQSVIDEQATRFIFENGTREDVRQAYKTFADLHVVKSK